MRHASTTTDSNRLYYSRIIAPRRCRGTTLPSSTSTSTHHHHHHPPPRSESEHRIQKSSSSSNPKIMARHRPDDDDDPDTAYAYPKREIRMQEEETSKWKSVGLRDDDDDDDDDYDDDDDGKEVRRDPNGYVVDVPATPQANPPNQPIGRVRMREDEATGKWGNYVVLERDSQAAVERSATPTSATTNVDDSDGPSGRSRGAGESASRADGDFRRDTNDFRPFRGLVRSNKPRRGTGGGAAASIRRKYAVRSASSSEGGLSKRGGNAVVDYANSERPDRLKYEPSGAASREANHFDGSTSKHAPEKLLIPPGVPKKAKKEEARDAKKREPSSSSSSSRRRLTKGRSSESTEGSETTSIRGASSAADSSGEEPPPSSSEYVATGSTENSAKQIKSSDATLETASGSASSASATAYSNSRTKYSNSAPPGRSPSVDDRERKHEGRITSRSSDSTDETTANGSAASSSAATYNYSTSSSNDRKEKPPLQSNYAPPAERRNLARSSDNLRYKEPDSNSEPIRYHWVEPDDSLRWICLKYKVNANDLRRANNFAGSNLKLAPKKLVIPEKMSNPRKVTAQRLRRPNSSGSTVPLNQSTSSFSSTSLPLLPALPRTGGGGGRKDDDSLASSSLFGVNSLAATEEFSNSSSANNLFSSSANDMHSGSSAMEGTTIDGITNNGGAGSSLFDLRDREEAETEFNNIATTPVAPMEMVHLQQQQQSSSQGGGYNTALFNTIRNSVSMYDRCDSDSDASSSTGGGRRGANDTGGRRTGGRTEGTNAGGVRYHDVKPFDTVEHLCMKYRISAPALRRANIGLTGRNLQTGPKRLTIPPNADMMTQQQHQQQTHTTMTNYGNASYSKKDKTATTHDDETNTLALSDGHSALADQIAALEISDEGKEDGTGSSGRTPYHDVRPSDTLQGVCLLYGISAYELRRANHFRGLNLRSAPERLVIPRNERNTSKDFKTMTREEKIRSLMAHVPTMRQTKKPLLSHDEARAYLEFNDWNFDQALRNVKVDVEWSSQRSKVPTKSNNRSY